MAYNIGRMLKSGDTPLGYSINAVGHSSCMSVYMDSDGDFTMALMDPAGGACQRLDDGQATTMSTATT
jgi:hypothetical protein